MKFKKIIAVLLTFVMTFSMAGMAAASETGEALEAFPGSNNTEAEIILPEEEEAVSGNNIDTDRSSVSADKAEISAELDSIADKLDSMTPGRDYVDGEGVFIADSMEEAEEIALQYGADLKSYSHRVAVIDFPGSTEEALHDAAVDSEATKVVDPNYIGTFEGFDESVYKPLASTGAIVSSEAPNDPYADSSSEYYQYFHEKINTLKAHETTMGKGAKIAVIDLGTNPEHEDLGAASDDEHTQYVASLGSDTGVDTVGHGVFCNGIIKSVKNNGNGGYGVAPEAEVYSIKIANRKTFNMNKALEGLSMAIEDKVNVVNMSLGADEGMESLRQLVNEAHDQGITIIAAAGNGTNGYGHSSYHYPAAYDHVIAVAATDKDDNLAKYSNYGDWVDIAAPGSLITSTYLKNGSSVIGTPADNDHAYGRMSGTSMASPMVAAVAALCYGANPEFLNNRSCQVPDIITSIILNTTDGKSYAYGDHSVTGLLQADKAVEQAAYYKLNTTYSIIDQAGVHGAYLSDYIARGKSIKLELADINGNIIKNGAKETVWISSNPGVVSVDKGKIKCSKTATAGTVVTITAVKGSDTMTCKLTVTDPVIAAGYCYVNYTSSGTYKLKVKKTIPVNGSVGVVIGLQAPYELYNDSNPYINLVYSKKTSRIEDGTWGHACDDSYNYKINISKSKLKNITLYKDGSGKITGIKINSAGTYPVKFTTVDGSKKSFTFKIKAS